MSVSTEETSIGCLPLDMILLTETNRIIYCLDQLLYKSHLVGLLQYLGSSEGAQVLGRITNPNQMVLLQNVLSEYTTAEESPTDDFEEEIEESSVKTCDYFHKKREMYSTDEDYDRLLLLLYENNGMKNVVTELEEKVSKEMKVFIRCIQEVRDSVLSVIGETTAEAKEKESYLRECFSKNEKAKREIKELEEELNNRKNEMNTAIIGKNIMINRYQNKIGKMKKQSEENIKKKVKESEMTMEAEVAAYLIKQDQLEQDVTAATKMKAENQLITLLHKFDGDMAQKTKEEEDLQKGFDKEKIILVDIQKKYDEQVEEYDELMQEKAEYDQMVLEQKLLIFMMNRSARRIQRTWRAHRVRKMAKKKAKKEKKGKKSKK